jgi:hypothetical protein
MDSPGKEWFLNKALRIDDDVAETLYSGTRRVPTYTKSQITSLKNNYNGATPDPGYISGWKLTLDGLASGLSICLDIRNLLTRFSVHEQITRLVCVEGWSAIAWWAGLRFDDLLGAYPSMSQAKWARVESQVNLDASGNPDPYFMPLDLPTRFTFGDFDLRPIWASDGSGIIFASPRDGLPPNLFTKALTSGAEEKRLMRSGIDSIATDWSHDGRYVVYMANELGTNWNIWAIPLVGDQTPQLVLRTQFNEGDARISPDGRWLAYVSDESGKWEVYAQRFLSPGGKWQISSIGGNQPEWSHDGSELLYVAADQKLMAVPVHVGASLDPGTPKELFQLQAVADFLGNTYDVAADDQRFLVNTPVAEETSQPLTVVVNWTAALKAN